MLSSRASFSNDASARMQSLLVVTDKKFGTRLAATLIIGLAVALLIGIAGYMTVDRLTRLRSQAVSSHNLALSLTDIMKSVDDAESGQRGFIITGDEAYLDQYNKAKLALPASFSSLEALVSPEDKVSTSILMWDIGQKMDELQETIDLRRTKGYDSARSVVMTGRGQELMERIRTRVSTLSADQESTYSSLLVRIGSLYQRLLFLMAILLTFELVLFVGVLFMIMRDRAE